MQQTCESGHQPIMFVGDCPLCAMEKLIMDICKKGHKTTLFGGECPICVKEVPLLDKFRRLLDVFLDTSVAFGKVKDELATANDRIKARDTQIAQRDKTIASLVNPIRRFVADMPCTLRVSPKESSSDH